MFIIVFIALSSFLNAMQPLTSQSAPAGLTAANYQSFPISAPTFVSAKSSGIIPPTVSHERIDIDMEANHPHITIDRNDAPCQKQKVEENRCLCSAKVKLALIAATASVLTGGISAIITYLTVEAQCKC